MQVKDEVIVSKDDRYILPNGTVATQLPIIYNDISEDGSYNFILGINSQQTKQLINIPGTNMFLGISKNTSYTNRLLIFQSTIDTANKSISFKQVKTVYLLIGTSKGYPNGISLSGNNEKIIVLISKTSTISPYYELFDIQTILNATDASSVAPEFSELAFGTEEYLYSNTDGGKFFARGKNSLSSIKFDETLKEIIGVKYKENYFYRQTPHILTAGQPDVRAGKTFIGWMGTQETGTMEVSEE